eukprot:TRINITY_DN69213_c0_g1_i1.p1 TRINITY_DN69213_c0_g1~~TRINITY_DN69213_c0_g1_i1.p1  ORF type:complete len:331 (+),score=61.35 TRINITY_DN69213_c0_g1_i1:234-1226(+)
METIVAAAGILANVAGTTGVIASNKALLVRQRFPFILTGLSLNFGFTFAFLTIATIVFDAFQPKTLPSKDRGLLALSAVCTILFNNASVEANSVGTYQISKLLIVPVIIAFERYQGIHRTYTPSMVVALAFITLGVGITTVTDVELTSRGIAIATCSTFLTAHYQIWQGSKQRQHGLNSWQITHTMMPPQLCLAVPCSVALDLAWPSLKRFILLPDRGLLDRENGVLRFLTGPGGPSELAANIVFNNAMAVLINLSSYYLLNLVSPVTYQILGQVKTLLTIVIGYMIFDMPPPPGWFVVRCCGVTVAVSSTIWYGHLKRRQAQVEMSKSA